MRAVKLVSVFLSLAVLLLSGAVFAQTDPGAQTATRNTGRPLAQVANDDNGNNTGLSAFFANGLDRFQEVESVSNSPAANNGLGPRFNFNVCAGCHVAPAVGGGGPAVNPQFAGIGSCTNGAGAGPGGVSQTAPSVEVFTPLQNPNTFFPIPTPQQVGTVACNNNSANPNATPFFITQNGPTREARFPFFFNANGTANTANPNGGVEDLFTVSGRQDGAAANILNGTSGCSIAQPSFAAAQAANNIIFRIPISVFGEGLIENLDESTLLQDVAAANNNNLGITGTFNHNGNDGTISRFGWKAQNKSMLLFAGEAYNVEMGISNELFMNDRPLPGEDGNGGQGGLGLPVGCLNLTGTGYPEDTSNPNATPDSAVQSDIEAFADFMRGLAPPPPGGVILNGTAVAASSISNGLALFKSIGCAVCHNPNLGNTQVSNFTTTSRGVGSLSVSPVPAFGDFAIHHMGTGLADNVSQGLAGGDQFRTAPLWGVGQRIFLLHDGRTTSLLTAIEQHESTGSEASNVEENFDALTASQKQDVLNFLRSL